MLADRKIRKKYCLNPQGNYWTNDKSKFGQKLLEKMGWKEGQGLGANNQGITERIKVRFRLDNNAGFGFNDTDDTLVQQEQYLSLLSSLNSKPVEPIDNSKVSSLEDKSRKSKARVHYKKFTRGKDLSRYTSKDLVGIFGIRETENGVTSDEVNGRSVDSQGLVINVSHELGNGLHEESDNAINNDQIETTTPAEECPPTQKVKKRVSFKLDIEDQDSKKDNDDDVDDDDDDDGDSKYKSNESVTVNYFENPQKSKKPRKADQVLSFVENDDRRENCDSSQKIDENELELIDKETKAKKSKKRDKMDTAPLSEVNGKDENCDQDQEIDEQFLGQINSSSNSNNERKSKKRKRNNETPALDGCNTSELDAENQFKKSKKNSKLSSIEEEGRDNNCDSDRNINVYADDKLEVTDTNNSSKKSRKAKNKQKKHETLLEETNEELENVGPMEDDIYGNGLGDNDTVSHSKKKKKSKKLKEPDEIACMKTSGADETYGPELEKQNYDVDDRLQSPETVNHSTISKKSKKRQKSTEKGELCKVSSSNAETQIADKLDDPVYQDPSNNTCIKEQPNSYPSRINDDYRPNRRYMIPDEQGFQGSNLHVISGYVCN